MKVIYIDCSAGLSGSALLGAMVELGIEQELLISKIKNIIPVPFQLNFSKRQINGITTTSALLKVETSDKSVPVAAFANILNTKVLTGDGLGKRLNTLFDKLNQAQARIFGLPVSEATMSEAEMIKTLIIATGFFTALDLLGIEKVISTALPVGLHFEDQNSAPLLMELAKGTAVKQVEGQKTILTPLGVGLLSCRVDIYAPIPEMLLHATGYGSSAKDPLNNSLVRLLYGSIKYTETPFGQSETIKIVETAIDDMNPELFPFLIEHLINNGAIDAFIIPIYMKKGRPAHLLTVLCNKSRLEYILFLIFKETTTLGVRIREEKRRILPRHSLLINTPYGQVTVKMGFLTEGGPPVNCAPEFEDCKKLALQLDIPVKEIYAAAQRAAHEYLSGLSQNPNSI